MAPIRRHQIALLLTLSFAAALVTLSRATEEATEGPFEGGVKFVMKKFGGQPAFITHCSSSEHEDKVLAIFATFGKGVLLERWKGTVVNITEYDFPNGPGPELETHGGAYSRERVSKLIRIMEGGSFILVRSVTRDSLLPEKIGVPCYRVPLTGPKADS